MRYRGWPRRSAFILGLCHYYSGDYEGAAAFQEVAASVPLNEVYNDLGAAQAQRNDFTSAAASYRKALEGDSADPDYHFKSRLCIVEVGTVRGRGGKLSAALERNDNEPKRQLSLDCR